MNKTVLLLTWNIIITFLVLVLILQVKNVDERAVLRNADITNTLIENVNNLSQTVNSNNDIYNANDKRLKDDIIALSETVDHNAEVSRENAGIMINNDEALETKIQESNDNASKNYEIYKKVFLIIDDRLKVLESK